MRDIRMLDARKRIEREVRRRSLVSRIRRHHRIAAIEGRRIAEAAARVADSLADDTVVAAAHVQEATVPVIGQAQFDAGVETAASDTDMRGKFASNRAMGCNGVPEGLPPACTAPAA